MSQLEGEGLKPLDSVAWPAEGVQLRWTPLRVIELKNSKKNQINYF
jgi:hypothetical protein